VSPELVILCHLNYCADYYAQKPTQRAGVPCPPSDQAHLCTAVAKRPIVTRGDEETRVESVWDTGKEHVMMESTFAFDFFTRSRTPTELRRRVETLCRSMEKELAKPLKREREKRQRAEDAHEVVLMKRLRTLVPKKRKR
jgi:hypothetical protein